MAVTRKPVAKKATPKSTRGSATTTQPAVALPVKAPRKRSRAKGRSKDKKYRVRVRMYRQGLGDCFLLSFPRAGQRPFQILIDCGALARGKVEMTKIVEHIRDSVIEASSDKKARLDAVVGTHEHKDHLSGFNQAREVFNKDFVFGSVWLGWTENLSRPEIQKIKQTRKKAILKLQEAMDSPQLAASAGFDNIKGLLGFSQDDDSTGAGRVSDAVEYLKLRGKEAGDLRYLEPGMTPFALNGVDGVRVFVLGPPRDIAMLKTSAVTEKMKKDGTIYHLSGSGEVGIDALGVALPGSLGQIDDKYHPFAIEHRIPRQIRHQENGDTLVANPYFTGIQKFVETTYDSPSQSWRRIDEDWLSSFEQLALNLDSDTNNTSVVLAFEFVTTGEVLLFVADAQIGSWLSWANLEFDLPGREKPLPAHDLIGRTVFYKVGHHCSHNATLRNGGLELMRRDDLVAFIPLDRTTAGNQGKTGWQMPAPPLFKALQEKAGRRVVISDINETPPAEALTAGVIATDLYVDYFLI